MLSCECGPGRPPEVSVPNDEESVIEQPTVNPRLPGIEEFDEALEAELRALLASKAEDYEPRTRHIRDDGEPEYVNRLIGETSPYLLQHAHNPVNWAPWGEEAFERARREGKPILLSVGYSTCHWCHVMEHESFEDTEIAAFINAHFVPIKVDREERPDIDDIYMTAVHMLAGRGGWPMTIAMTPDGDPFFGGTYFPPRAGVRGARRGFVDILEDLSTRYREEPAAVVAEAQALSQRIQAQTAPQRPGDVPAPSVVPAAAHQIARSFDARWGGFGRAPKFPQPSRIGLLLRAARRTGDSSLNDRVVLTLQRMAEGGMYDHVGGGFHRYSTDTQWLVPHFEKMLYDNAQLVVAYLEGYQATGETDFLRVARETLDYVARDMRAPGGGFYSATDADSMTPSGHSEEGYYFTWSLAEIRAVLDDESEANVLAYYPVLARGNFEGRTILHTPRTLAEVAEQQGVTPIDLRAQVNAARDVLWRAREADRALPLRDDKVLTAWNGLMISAFAKGAFVLDSPEYLQIAEGAASFLLESLRDDAGLLQRSHIGGEARHRAYLQDSSFLIAGLLDLHEASGDIRWVRSAIELQSQLDAHYLDTNGGYFMTASDAERLLARDKPASDGAVPSGNSVALDNLLRLASLTGEESYREAAERLMASFSQRIQRYGAGLPRLLQGVDRYNDTEREVIIVESEPGAARALVRVLAQTFLPNRVAMVVREPISDEARALIPLLEGKAVLEGTVTAFVCERGRCELPTSDPSVFRAQLQAVRPY